MVANCTLDEMDACHLIRPRAALPLNPSYRFAHHHEQHFVVLRQSQTLLRLRGVVAGFYRRQHPSNRISTKVLV